MFRVNKPILRPFSSFRHIEVFKKVGRQEFFSNSEQDVVYQVDHGHLIDNSRTLWEECPPVYGDNVPDHVAERAPFRSLPLYAMNFQDGFVNPTWGVVLNSRYALFEPSAWAAQWRSPDLTQVPGISSRDGTVRLEVSQLPKKTLRGSYLVLNHWGGKNYGHFVLDSLPGVLLFYREILQGELRIVTGPLKHWQREYLEILGVEAARIVSVDKDIFLKCERLTWPSSLQGNLQRPSPLTQAVGTLLVALTGMKEPTETTDRTYISRAAMTNRQFSRRLENEEELIRALAIMGFVVIRPEEYSVADQIAIFSKAKIIVGETGAAMANIIFAPPGCRVVEIMPEHRSRVWAKRLCGLLDLAWYCVFASVPPEKRAVTMIDGVQYNNLDFRYEVNTANVIEAVDRAMDHIK